MLGGTAIKALLTERGSVALQRHHNALQKLWKGYRPGQQAGNIYPQWDEVIVVRTVRDIGQHPTTCSGSSCGSTNDSYRQTRSTNLHLHQFSNLSALPPGLPVAEGENKLWHLPTDGVPLVQHTSVLVCVVPRTRTPDGRGRHITTQQD